MKNILHTIDRRILTWATALFLIIIPLYPKFPSMRIYDTYISVRLEDFYVGIMALIYGIQLLRRRILIDRQLTRYIVLFLAAVMLSWVFNYAVAQIEVLVKFRNVSLLNALRRIEYVIPFFVAYAAVRSEMRSHPHDGVSGRIHPVARRLLNIALFVIMLVCLYGLGQKSAAVFQPVRDWLQGIYMTQSGITQDVAYFFFRFFDFPAVQTMNAEFARGHLLNLTPDARVSSTFAGHYDLAAYLVFFIPLLAASILSGVRRVRSSATYIMAIFTLILTASRISFGAYIVSIIAFFTYTRRWKALALTILLTIALNITNGEMTTRFKDMFQKTQVFENVVTGEEIINQVETSRALPAGSEFIAETAPAPVAKADKKTINNLKLELAKKEVDEARKRGAPITQEQALALVDKKYSDLRNIVVREVVAGDTSLATRTQVAWPRALRAWASNPLLGTGPYSVGESTDGDYMRWLAETGALGTILFIVVLSLLFVRSWRAAQQMKSGDRYIYLGYCAGIVALAINALLIDVFEASKVAYTFWTVSGILIASIQTPQVASAHSARA